MPPWCTCLFCIGWLRNVQTFITRAESLYDSLNPLLCDAFATVFVFLFFARSLLLWSIKSHDVDLLVSVFCLLLYLGFKPRSHWKIPNQQLSSSTMEKHCHLSMEISGNSPRNIWSNSNRPWTRKSIPESGVIYGVSTETESWLDVVFALGIRLNVH